MITAYVQNKSVVEQGLFNDEIYDNGTESDLLMRSLQKVLDRDETGRLIVEMSADSLFSGVSDSYRILPVAQFMFYEVNQTIP